MNQEDVKEIQKSGQMLEFRKILELNSRDAQLEAFAKYLREHYCNNFDLCVLSKLLTQTRKVGGRGISMKECERAVVYRNYRTTGLNHEDALEAAGNELICSTKTIEAAETKYSKWMQHLSS